MPRAGWVKPTNDHRLSDHLSWALLMRVFPPDLVDRVVADCGRQQQRRRLLPARAVVYYVMGLALFSQSSYEEVMETLVAGQAWSTGTGQRWEVPTKAALFKARDRLGPEPLEALFARVAETVAAPDRDRPPAAWRLMGLDSACLDLPDTEPNDEAFGRPTGEVTRRAVPQVRVVGLTDLVTRSIVDATVGGVRDRKPALALDLLGRLPGDALVMAGRGFFSYQAWTTAAAGGCELLWRLRSDLSLPVLDRLEDGSYLARLHPEVARPRDAVDGVTVRIIDAEVDEDAPGSGGPTSRLATTLTDPDHAAAPELVGLYESRWRIGSAFDELRAQAMSPELVLRSKGPGGVRQEVFGYLCVHLAVRWLIEGVSGGSGPLDSSILPPGRTDPK